MEERRINVGGGCLAWVSDAGVGCGMGGGMRARPQAEGTWSARRYVHVYLLVVNTHCFSNMIEK